MPTPRSPDSAAPASRAGVERAPGAGAALRPRQLGEILKAGSAHLEQAGVPQPRLAFEHFAAHVLGCRRLELYLRFDSTPSDAQVSALRAGLRRLAAHEPLQYVMGFTEFLGHRFRTDGRALIPRPETEILVEAVLGEDSLWQRPTPALADVGTGTGCIAISLALARPAAAITAIDPSADALALARENAATLGAGDRVTFVSGEWLAGAAAGSLSAVVSNPPYVRTPDWARLEPHVRDHEPRLALDGGADGLAAYRPIATQAYAALTAGGLLFLEIGYDQKEAVTTILAEAGYGAIRCQPDLAGRDRVIRAVRP